MSLLCVQSTDSNTTATTTAAAADPGDAPVPIPQAHGIGIIKYDNGDIYCGNFAYGQRSGAGKYRYATGDKYIAFLSTRTGTEDRDKAKRKREALTRGEGRRNKGAKKGGDKYEPPLSETDIFATVEMVKDVSSVLIWEGVWREDKKHGEGRLGG